jgi:hypothetical protein
LQKKYGELFWGREKFFSFGSVTIFFWKVSNQDMYT